VEGDVEAGKVLRAKALYRRALAQKEQGQLKEAIAVRAGLVLVRTCPLCPAWINLCCQMQGVLRLAGSTNVQQDPKHLHAPKTGGPSVVPIWQGSRSGAAVLQSPNSSSKLHPLLPCACCHARTPSSSMAWTIVLPRYGC
jgi:hypothetical protein